MLSKRFVSRSAEVTIEVSLSIALSILVLFLALGLFSTNLSTMAANSGIFNMFNRKSGDEFTTTNTAKTKYDDWGAGSQTSVQIVADNATTTPTTLDEFTKWADGKINDYASLPNSQLTQAQLEDLAKALTIKTIAGSDVSDIALGHGITINKKFGYTVTADKLVSLSFKKSYSPSSSYGIDVQLEAMQSIN